jgi:exopolysaccharide biosynthesis polyprenyl glycosylphosphotransferase
LIKEHRRSIKVMRLAFDLGLVTLFYYALYESTLRLANPFGLVLDHPGYASRLPLLLALGWAFGFLASGVYDHTRSSPGLGGALNSVFRVMAFSLLAIVVAAFVFKFEYLSRKFMVVYVAGCFLLLTLSKALESRLVSTLRRMNFNTLSVLLVGEGEALRHLAEAYAGHGEWGYRVVGLLSVKAPRPKDAWGVRRLGPPDKIAEVLRTRIVDEVVVSLSPRELGHLDSVLGAAAVAGIRVRMLLPDALQGWRPELDPLGGIMDSLVLSQERSRPYARLFKGLLDSVGAGLLLVLLSPVLAALSLAIVVSGGWPVFFKQKRAGVNGRVFNLYKVRTMVVDARSKQDELQEHNQMGGPVFKIKNDPRITPLGRWLRRFSLDELPQLLNVLRGEISLVGPRPLAQYEARKVPAWAWRRFSVKPGITCLWQISGRNQLSFEDWMRLDLKYVDEWSLGLDLRILFQTLPAVLNARGAY